MKKFSVLLAALVVSTTANADWSYVTSNESGDDYFLDFDTLKTQDGFRYIWYLGNYLKPDKWGDMSVKVLYQIDCRKLASKRLALYYFNQPMGNGDPTTTDTDFKEDFDNPSPGSVDYRLIKNTCDH